jgi:hypothetical protein
VPTKAEENPAQSYWYADQPFHRLVRNGYDHKPAEESCKKKANENAPVSWGIQSREQVGDELKKGEHSYL